MGVQSGMSTVIPLSWETQHDAQQRIKTSPHMDFIFIHDAIQW